MNDIKIKIRSNERRIYVAIALALFVGIFTYRVVLFSDLEPRSDQAFFSWWVQGLVQADQVLSQISTEAYSSLVLRRSYAARFANC